MLISGAIIVLQQPVHPHTGEANSDDWGGILGHWGGICLPSYNVKIGPAPHRMRSAETAVFSSIFNNDKK